MFQFEDLDPGAPPKPREKIGSAVGGEHPRRALLAWGEHCVECAAPACYSSCDLYDPTPAGKCRRFEGGIVRNHELATERGPAADVVFKRWGKLEAQGNAALIDDRRLRLIERVLGTVARPANRIGAIVARATGDQRWATPMEALHKRINRRLEARREAAIPEAFAFDIVNPGDKPVTLILSAMVDRNRLTRDVRVDQLPRPMSKSITLAPGHSREIIPVPEMRDVLVSGLPYNLALSPEADDAAHLIFRSLDLVALDGVATRAAPITEPATLPAAKCVIFDLDNTLWDGILLEGEVGLRDGVLDLFKALDERGILISVASKNAREDAIARLKAFGLDEYLLHPQIGWAPKSEGVRRIAEAIDIGRDTLIFVDDNPFERAEVAEAVPGVAVLPDSAIAALADHPRLQGAVTPESKARRKMYQQAIAREETAASFGDDYLEFLRSCGIAVEIRRDRPDDFERIVELVQRTNQLNFSGRKYGRDEISAILRDPSRERHVIICSDRFGSYGTVGFCLSRREGDTLVIDDFMLSCRVQGKFIEQALFWHLAEASGPQASAIEVNFRRTDRNRAAEMVLEKLGFETEREGLLRRDIAPGELAVDFMTINAPSDRAA